MTQKRITEIEKGEIPATFIKFGNTFSLVAYHYNKTYTREEGLKIKNQYGMKGYTENRVYCYKGIVPKSLFLGGLKTEGVN